MPLAKPVLAALKKLGAEVPEDAASLHVSKALASVRWPKRDFESRPKINHWFEPLRLNLCVPHPYREDPVPGSEGHAFLQLGSTDDQFLLVRARDLEADVSDPAIVVFDPEDNHEPPLSIPLSTLLKNLRVKKPTAKSLKKLIEGIEKPSVHIVREALAEGADVNASIRRDVMISPLGLAMRNIFRKEADEIVVELLKAGADPNHPIVISTILSGAGQSLDAYYNAIRAVFAHGGRIPPKHPSSTMPALTASPRSLELMIEHGLDANALVTNAYINPPIVISALCDAVWRGGYERAAVLVRRGANVSYVAPPYGLTPLHFAVVAAEADRLVPLLTEAGAKDRRSGALPAGLLMFQRAPVEIERPGLLARELAERIGRPEIAALIGAS